MTDARDPQAGFTLIEALVAMTVLAVGALSLLSAAEGHTSRINALSDRIAARWAADYGLAALRLGFQPETVERQVVMGLEFDLRIGRAATADADLQRVEIAVASAGYDSVLHVLDGYIDTGGDR